MDNTEESFVIIYHNNNNNDNNNNNNNSNNNNNKEYEENIDHLTSRCRILAQNEHIVRHDKVYTHLHYPSCKKLEAETAEHRHSHIHKAVCEHENVTVL
jgi:hypothetical protein